MSKIIDIDGMATTVADDDPRVARPDIPITVPQFISRKQFFQQLAVQQTITPAEALAALQVGAIPSAMQALVSALPTDQQFAVQMAIIGDQTFDRSSAIVNQLAVAEGWASTLVDAFWTAASVL